MSTAACISITDIFQPKIIAAEKHFLIVYKPPRMHSAPLKNCTKEETILRWCMNEFPEVTHLVGRKDGEGGLLHRLDYETQGLLIIARTQAGMDALLQQQNDTRIVKEYCALTYSTFTMEQQTTLQGFPVEIAQYTEQGILHIQSGFRAYGIGRRVVRPVLSGNQYRTEIIEKRSLDAGITSCRVRIVRGFRHQIRCHLAWLNSPIVNDPLYGGKISGKGFLGLRACSLTFSDPASGRELRFSIPELSCDEV